MNKGTDWFRTFAHDARSRLNGVIGLSQILQEEELTDEQKDHVNGILKCGNDLLILIDHQAQRLTANTATAAEKESNAVSTAPERIVTNTVGPAQETSCPLPNGHLILAVDDEPENLSLLVHSLTKAGYSTVTAHNANDALGILKETIPDIILLDVMMPGTNGFELCQKIRTNTLLAETPILFLSGATDLESRLGAYTAGGTDFILKPFYAREVLAKVNTHMTLLSSRRELKKYATSLEKMVQEKTDQLIHADRLVHLGTMSAGVAHEINNPLTFVKGNLNLLKKFQDVLSGFRSNEPAPPDLHKKIDFIREEMPKTLSEMEVGLNRVSTILSGLKTFARQDSTEKSVTNIRSCIDDALMLVRSELKNKVRVENKCANTLPPIWASPSQLIQVFVNLFVNAAHAMADRNPATLTIDSDRGESSISIRISDTGRGIPEDVVQKIWHPFFTTKPKGIGTGLGLSIVHGIMHDHEGEILVNSEVGKGTTFTLGFPVHVV